MKKLLSGLICVSMLFSGVVLAEENPMQNALAEVKIKADIPPELTEFDSRSYNSEARTQYHFSWHTVEGDRELSVSCDNEGRIDSYNEYRRYETEETAALSGHSRASAKTLAEGFVKKLLPEAFDGDDILVCTEESGVLNQRGTRYSFTFERQKSGIKVSNNTVSVTVIATEEGMYPSDLWTNYDYNAEFITGESEIENPDAAYKSVFPLKLHYVKDYKASEGSETDVTKLIYTVEEYGRGYISAETGEKVTENYDLYSGAGGGSNQAMKEEAAVSDSAADRFTEQELAELEAVAGLKKPEEIEAILRSFADLKMDESLKLESYSIYKNNNGHIPRPLANTEEKPEDKYTMNLRFAAEGENRSLNATADAKTGEITYISNRKYTDRPYDYRETPLTDEQKAFAEEKALGFFEQIAPKISGDFEVKTVDGYSQTASVGFIRIANSIEYSDNSAYISYDAENEMISQYSVHHTKAEFDDPAPAIEAEEQRYDELLEKYPLEKAYIRTDGGKYRLCYMMSGFSQINALTGEMENREETITGNYTDISGHWSESAVRTLADVGIGLVGSEFMPDTPITKAELLSLFASGLKGRGYIYYDITSLMDEMKRIGIVPQEETVENGEQPVLREDACVYMIRFAGHEKIAKLDIYKTKFADGDTISPEKLGYAAILSGMGVVSGDGGYLRPADKITRAEAVMMLYKYLIHR